MTAQPNAIRLRLLNADQVELAEPAHPLEQLHVTVPGRCELATPEHPPNRVDHRSVVSVAVSVDSAHNLNDGFCHADHLPSSLTGTLRPGGRT